MLAKTKLATALAICLSISACSTMTRINEQIENTETTARELHSQILQGAESSAVVRRTTPKLAGERISVVAETILPALFKDDIFYTTSGQTLERVLSGVSEASGMAIRLTEFAERNGTTQDSNYGNRSGSRLINLAWAGSLEGLLDQLARESHLYWRYVAETDSVEFYLYDTRHFSVNLPSGSRSISGAISSSGSSDQRGNSDAINSGGSSTGSVGVQFGGQVIDPYGAITRTITSMLLDDDPDVSLLSGQQSGQSSFSSSLSGGNSQVVQAQRVQTNDGLGRISDNVGRRGSNSSRVVVSPELATVTVTAPPPTLERVAEYIKKVNQQFARNLTVDLQIFDVALDDETGLGFSMELLYQRMNDYGLTLTGGPAVPFGRGPSGQLTFEVADPSSRFNGSSLLSQALATFGSVAVSTSGQVLAVNGQPAPFQVADEISFLASTAVRQDRTGVDPVTGTPLLSPLIVDLTPGSVVVGLTANFLPQILDDNRILLQYQLTVSELRSLVTVTSGTASIQTPNVFSQSIQQQAILRDGQSIVLFGFEQDRAQKDTTVSTGGGSRVLGNKRSLRVIQIQVFGGGSNA